MLPAIAFNFFESIPYIIKNKINICVLYHYNTNIRHFSFKTNFFLSHPIIHPEIHPGRARKIAPLQPIAAQPPVLLYSCLFHPKFMFFCLKIGYGKKKQGRWWGRSCEQSKGFVYYLTSTLVDGYGYNTRCAYFVNFCGENFSGREKSGENIGEISCNCYSHCYKRCYRKCHKSCYKIHTKSAFLNRQNP